MERESTALLDEEQFEFIARMMHAHGPSRAGAKLILVEGMRPCDAGRALGIEPNRLYITIRHYRRTYQEIQELFVWRVR